MHKFIEAGSLHVLQVILNGGVFGGNQIIGAGRIQGLHGLTLIIGAETVTFSDATGVGLTSLELKAAIEADTTDVTASFYDRRLLLTKTTGITVDKDGTANGILGFGSSADEVGVVYNPPDGAAPRVLSISGGAYSDSYFAHVEVP